MTPQVLNGKKSKWCREGSDQVEFLFFNDRHFKNIHCKLVCTAGIKTAGWAWLKYEKKIVKLSFIWKRMYDECT